MLSLEYLNDLNQQMSYKMELSHPKVKGRHLDYKLNKW
jgi:hypothetical protein